MQSASLSSERILFLRIQKLGSIEHKEVGGAVMIAVPGRSISVIYGNE